MAAIALIGPDGAGKTTITRALQTSGLLPFRYLYMGVSMKSTNLALPTSRIIERIKPWLRGREAASPEAGGPRPSRGSHGRGHVWAAGRLLNRLAEEWYRQLVSWYYQLRGYIVLYDRHYVFDFAPEIDPGNSLDRRIHRWLLMHLYPRPDLVLFLDAPGEVLFARKGELSVPELERRRQAFLRQGRSVPLFVRVDATQPLDEVYREIAGCIEDFCRARSLPRAPR